MDVLITNSTMSVTLIHFNKYRSISINTGQWQLLVAGRERERGEIGTERERETETERRRQTDR